MKIFENLKNVIGGIWKNPKKFILNKTGLCEKCMGPLVFSYKRKKWICPECIVNNTINEFKTKQ